MLDNTAVDELRPSLSQYKAVLLGPGLDQAAPFLVSFLDHLRQLSAPPPLVIDADGLNLLAQQADWVPYLPPQTILTPHPAELARLLAQPLAQVLAQNRLTLALACAAQWDCVLVLKGAYTAVAAPHATLGSVGTIIPCATPLLGTAGSGDVLAGVITALRGQGLGAYEAAVVGAFWHGRVGEHLTQSRGVAGVLASEIADGLVETRP